MVADPNKRSCAGPIGTINVLLGDGDDVLDVLFTDPEALNQSLTVAGGAGDDVLFGTTADDEMDGGDDDDFLTGGLGDDELNGDAGIDTIELRARTRRRLVVAGLEDGTSFDNGIASRVRRPSAPPSGSAAARRPTISSATAV